MSSPSFKRKKSVHWLRFHVKSWDAAWMICIKFCLHLWIYVTLRNAYHHWMFLFWKSTPKWGNHIFYLLNLPRKVSIRLWTMCLILSKGGSDEIQENPFFSYCCSFFFFPLLRLSVVLLNPTNNSHTVRFCSWYLLLSKILPVISPVGKQSMEDYICQLNCTPSAGWMTGISLSMTSPRISDLI